MAKIVGISLSKGKGVPRDSIEEGMMIEDFGLEGDARGGKGSRQISILGIETREKIRIKGIKGICSNRFAENLSIQGIELYKMPVGTRVEIGESLHEITQIGKECHAECSILQDARSCVMPLESIFTKVIKGGVVRVGDEIKVL